MAVGFVLLGCGESGSEGAPAAGSSLVDADSEGAVVNGADTPTIETDVPAIVDAESAGSQPVGADPIEAIPEIAVEGEARDDPVPYFGR